MLNIDDMNVFIWGMFFGVIGMGYFSYGRKQKAIIPLISGISLFVVPYFISNVYLLVGAGVSAMALPFFVKI